MLQAQVGVKISPRPPPGACGRTPAQILGSSTRPTFRESSHLRPILKKDGIPPDGMLPGLVGATCVLGIRGKHPPLVQEDIQKLKWDTRQLGSAGTHQLHPGAGPRVTKPPRSAKSVPHPLPTPNPSNFSLIWDFSPPLQSWVKPFGKGFNRLKNESVFRFRGIFLAGLCQYSGTAPSEGLYPAVLNPVACSRGLFMESQKGLG